MLHFFRGRDRFSQITYLCAVILSFLKMLINIESELSRRRQIYILQGRFVRPFFTWGRVISLLFYLLKRSSKLSANFKLKNKSILR